MSKPDSENEASFDDMYGETKDFFGTPYRELRDYFSNLDSRGSLLDLGCGQGRDALYLASLGYKVTALDNSKVGVEQMLDAARKQGLKINGVVDDVMQASFKSKFDVILFDMLLHSFEEDQQKILLDKYSRLLNDSGFLSIVFPDDITSDHFLDMLNGLSHKWNLTDEIIINDVPKIDDEDTDFTFKMICVKIV